MVYSKLLGEVIIATGVNDEFLAYTLTDGWTTVTLTTGRYRDITTLATEIASQLNSTMTGSWSCTVSDSTGLVTIGCSTSFSVDFGTDSPELYSTELRDLLGFDSDINASSGSPYIVVSDSRHQGGFYPLEPVENDSRPSETGSDTFNTDSYQAEGRTGITATKGGRNEVYFREISFLLAQSDLAAFSDWLKYLATGKSFAFYHDRDEAWPGPSSEYDEYVLFLGGDSPFSYMPSSVDGTKVWHRQSISMRKYVEASV